MLAPAAAAEFEPVGDKERECTGERERGEESGDEAPEVVTGSIDSSSNSACSCGGDIGKFKLKLGAVWKGMSVGDIYLLL